jgi:hypothetical protein
MFAFHWRLGPFKALALVYTRTAVGFHGVAQVLSLASLRFSLVRLYRSAML